MTIAGFWKELDDRLQKRNPAYVLSKNRISFPDFVYNFNIENGRFLNVGIDLAQWMFENSSISYTKNDDAVLTMVNGIASKIRYLKKYQVNFVFVFDGNLKLAKLRHNFEGDENDSDNTDTEELLFDSVYKQNLEKIESNSHIANNIYVFEMIKLFKYLNISYIFAPGDAEIELSRLSNAGIIDAVITNDADGFAYGCELILRNFSKFIDDKPSTFKGIAEKHSKEFYVTPISIHLLETIGLFPDIIMFIACMCGDDFSKGIKKLGPKKIWNLALKTSDYDFNCVFELRNIFISDNFKDYLLGKLPYNYSERSKLLLEYQNNFKNFINKYSKEIFGQQHTMSDSDISLSDFILATHFYPLCAKKLFQFSSFQTNLNEVDGTPKTKLFLPKFPQPLSIKSMNGPRYELYRGNDFDKIMTTSTFYDRKSLNNEPLYKDELSSIDWFAKLNYDKMKNIQIRNNTIKGYEYIPHSFGESYLWSAIVNFDVLGLRKNDIFIKNDKTIILKATANSNNKLQFYQVNYKAKSFFKKFMNYENDNNIEKASSFWLPSYLFDKEDNGRMLANNYKEDKINKSKKSSPRKNKLSPQKTTLDSLLKSPKHSRRLSDVSLSTVSGSSTISKSSKRSFDEYSDNETPSKKQKMTDPFFLDLEEAELIEDHEHNVSRVLEYPEDEGEGENEEEKKRERIEFNYNVNLDDGEVGRSNNNILSDLFKPKEELKKDKLSVDRNGSIMDKIPLIKPPSEAYNFNKFDLNDCQDDDLMDSNHNSKSFLNTEDSFSDTSSILDEIDRVIRQNSNIKTAINDVGNNLMDDQANDYEKKSNIELNSDMLSDSTSVLIELDIIEANRKSNGTNGYAESDSTKYNDQHLTKSINRTISLETLKDVGDITLDASIIDAEEDNSFNNDELNIKKKNFLEDVHPTRNIFEGTGHFLAENTDDSELWNSSATDNSLSPVSIQSVVEID